MLSAEIKTMLFACFTDDQKATRKMRDKYFNSGSHRNADVTARCSNCEFLGLRGMRDASAHERSAARKC